MKKTDIIILAGGLGKRMNSALPKALVPFMGLSLVEHVINNSENIGSKTVVVVGYKKELVIEKLKKYNVSFVHQEQPLGTGHAVKVAENEFKNNESDILVLFGDSPLISNDVLMKFVSFHKSNNYVASILTKDINNPANYGRIIRNENGTFMKSIEHKDLTNEYKNVKEINTGVMIFNSKALFDTLKCVNNNNSQNEYYLPDVVNILSTNGKVVGVFKSEEIPEIFAFNTIEELKKAEELITNNE